MSLHCGLSSGVFLLRMVDCMFLTCITPVKLQKVKSDCYKIWLKCMCIRSVLIKMMQSLC